MRIDAHQHFWSLERGDYGWLGPGVGAIYRDFRPADLAPYLARCGIVGTILVQAAPTEAETIYLLDLASCHATIAGVVGWVDFAGPDAAARIAHLARDPLLVGLRPMLQDLDDDGWILQPACVSALEAMRARSLVFDALIRPRHLASIDTLAARHPDLSIVVDHGAKPEIARDALDPWRAGITRLAMRPNVVVKLSGLATEARPGWTAADLAPYAHHILDAFGARRVMWGSDWPVLLLAGDYDHWFDVSNALLSSLGDADRAHVFGGTALATYLATRGRRPC